MKIIHCFFSMRTGGAQLIAIDLLNSLAFSHEVTLIVINDQWDDALLRRLNNTVAVYRLNRAEGSRNPLPVLQFNALLHQLKPDIIHCHERRMIQLIRYKRAKTVYTIHDVGIPTDTLRQYDALAAISQAVATDVYQRSGLPTNVIYNGILMDSFRKRTVYAVGATEPIRLVQVSRLMHEKKGQDVLLRAVAKLVGTTSGPVTLDLIGAGPSLNVLTELTQTLGIGSLVNFLGERDRTWIASHLADYHLLVQPSRYEGFGLTVLEGMAAGLPVVASDVDGPAEIMAGLPAGTLFTPDNADACAAALNVMLHAYRTTQIDAAATETYAIVRRKFSLATTAAGYLNLYQRLLARPETTAAGLPVASPFWQFILPQQRPV